MRTRKAVSDAPAPMGLRRTPTVTVWIAMNVMTTFAVSSAVRTPPEDSGVNVLLVTCHISTGASVSVRHIATRHSTRQSYMSQRSYTTAPRQTGSRGHCVIFMMLAPGLFIPTIWNCNVALYTAKSNSLRRNSEWLHPLKGVQHKYCLPFDTT